MLRFSLRHFQSSTNASGRQAVERQFGKSNIFARLSTRFADKLAKRRKIDDLADYVDQDLRFEFTSSFEYAMGGFTLLLMAVPIYLVTEGYTPPSKITVLMGMQNSKDYEDTWKTIESYGVPWWTSSIGHAALFFVLYQFTPYIRYPFFVHCLAPFYRKLGWVTHRFHAKQKAAELTKMNAGSKTSKSAAGAGSSTNSSKKNQWNRAS